MWLSNVIDCFFASIDHVLQETPLEVQKGSEWYEPPLGKLQKGN